MKTFGGPQAGKRLAAKFSVQHASSGDAEARAGTEIRTTTGIR
jgi:hypothetical protein